MEEIAAVLLDIWASVSGGKQSQNFLPLFIHLLIYFCFLPTLYGQCSDVCSNRAVIFHEPSGCVSVAVVLWLALSKETSPLIVVIHHSATGALGDHAAVPVLLEMSSG